MSELEEVAGWKMSELENDEVGKGRSWLMSGWLMSGWLMSGWQASELDFDVDPKCLLLVMSIKFYPLESHEN